MATTAVRRQASENRLKAMAHPLRRAILRYLIEHGTRAPVEIAIGLGEELGDVSYHMRRLATFGMVETVREEKVRGTVKHYFRHTDRHLVDTDEWNELDPMIRRGLLVDFAQPAVDDFSKAVRDGELGGNENFTSPARRCMAWIRRGCGKRWRSTSAPSRKSSSCRRAAPSEWPRAARSRSRSLPRSGASRFPASEAPIGA